MTAPDTAPAPETGRGVREPERCVLGYSYVCCKCGERMPPNARAWRLDGALRFACGKHPGPGGLNDRSTDVRPVLGLAT